MICLAHLPRAGRVFVLCLDVYRSQSIFSQLMQFDLWRAFSHLVARYHGNLGVNCAQQFNATAFAQLTRRKSLWDLVACLDAVPAKR